MQLGYLWRFACISSASWFRACLRVVVSPKHHHELCIPRSEAANRPSVETFVFDVPRFDFVATIFKPTSELGGCPRMELVAFHVSITVLLASAFALVASSLALDF